MEVLIFQKEAFEEMAAKFSRFSDRVNELLAKQGGKSLNRWMDNQEVCRQLNISPRTLQTLRDNGTIWEKCMWLKGVVMRAHFNGLIPRNPFAQFHISPNVKEREFLTEDELKAVMTHEFADPKLAYIRDLFVFASFTALSFVDIKELTNDRIVEVNGEKWIISKRHKTGVPFQVKLLDIPLQIIERYRPFQENNLVFPNLNYWSICKPLKKMIRECGVNKDISFHCSRHGFATLALCKGMPIESVSRILGHTNIETTQIYAKITVEKLDNDLTMLGDKLSKSFGNIKVAGI